MSQSTSGVKVTAKMPLSQSLLRFENLQQKVYKEGHFHELISREFSIILLRVSSASRPALSPFFLGQSQSRLFNVVPLSG